MQQIYINHFHAIIVSSIVKLLSPVHSSSRARVVSESTVDSQSLRNKGAESRPTLVLVEIKLTVMKSTYEKQSSDTVTNKCMIKVTDICHTYKAIVQVEKHCVI